ncbi:MAG: STAS domain-containing protein [Stenomitos rutilans HA7619-LM2]|nr:STAS domain-containing protein [Stenomitos rutilans HA7619-LM2]
MVLAYADVPRRLNLVPDLKPSILVLQPNGSLNASNSHDLQHELEQALEQATETVLVDLLWVEAIDACGIAALVAGLQYAAKLGKFLSFQSMKDCDRCALETTWAHQQEMSAGAWTHTFSCTFESFLDHFSHA